MDRILLVFLIVMAFGVIGSCTGGGADAGMDPQAFYDKWVSANGKPFGNVHQLHVADDGTRLAQCLDCHAVHGMTFDWQNVDRAYCLTCHTDKTNHHQNQDCMSCHNNSGGPGGG